MGSITPSPDRARLVGVHEPAEPRGIALLLHGGASRGAESRVSPTQLSVLRMIPIAQRIARAGGGRIAVHRLLNSHRGWDETRTPVMDAVEALDRLGDRFPGLPVCLVGHSLGGRAALLAGGAAPVRSVVALNPWLYPSDSPDLRGRRVLVVHGTEDRVAPIGRAAVVVERISGHTAAQLLVVPGGKHAMLRLRQRFEGPAVDFVVETLLSAGTPPE